MNNIDDIIILGGGSSGWMTASTLIKSFPKKKITVIESPNDPIIGVGESTLQPIRGWIKYLGIDEKDFLKHTDGSYKLSIKFTDFYEKNTHFHYPFGKIDVSNNFNNTNDWWFKKILNPNTRNSDYADCIFPQMALINENKIYSEIDNNIDFKLNRDSAFHFDAIKFGQWLKNNYCIPRGVNYIKEDITLIEKDENGIKCLNKKYKADLYVDCTGFKSLLLDKTLKEEFISFNDLLPNNSAWATRIPYTDIKKQLVAYTNCTAIENGWVWNIPLWSRIGTGYVYSDKFVSDETALCEFKKHLKMNTDNLEFKKIKMRVGIHKKLWVKNVVAIGLSAGFIEPLESNGLFTVHEFLFHLVRNLNKNKISQFDKDNFNYCCRQIFQNFAEFVALHYALSQRDDTEYWKNNLNKEWSKTLLERKCVLTNGIDEAVVQRNFNFQFDTNIGLHCIAAGMNWQPTDLYSLIKYNELSENEWLELFKKTTLNLDIKKTKWKEYIKNKPILYDFLKNNIYDKK
jgi:hypothetical protein